MREIQILTGVNICRAPSRVHGVATSPRLGLGGALASDDVCLQDAFGPDGLHGMAQSIKVAVQSLPAEKARGEHGIASGCGLVVVLGEPVEKAVVELGRRGHDEGATGPPLLDGCINGVEDRVDLFDVVGDGSGAAEHARVVCLVARFDGRDEEVPGKTSVAERGEVAHNVGGNVPEVFVVGDVHQERDLGHLGGRIRLDGDGRDDAECGPAALRESVKASGRIAMSGLTPRKAQNRSGCLHSLTVRISPLGVTTSI